MLMKLVSQGHLQSKYSKLLNDVSIVAVMMSSDNKHENIKFWFPILILAHIVQHKQSIFNIRVCHHHHSLLSFYYSLSELS